MKAAPRTGQGAGKGSGPLARGAGHNRSGSVDGHRLTSPPHLGVEQSIDAESDGGSTRAPRRAADLNAEFLRAVRDPLAWEILTILSEREACATEVADDLDFNTQGEKQKVYYRFRKLHKVGLIEPVDTDIRKGGTQHIFKAVVRPKVNIGQAELQSREVREAISASIVPRLVKDFEVATDSRAMDSHPQRTLLREMIVSDWEGMNEMAEACEAHLERMKKIQVRAAARLSARGKEGFNVQTHTVAIPVTEAVK